MVAIVACAGFMIPKISSHAITSPSGTADMMETLTNVDLSITDMRKVVARERASITWGGGINICPADDVLIRIERILNLDSEGQMIASVLSKKAAIGSTHVVIDMPMGPTVKIRSYQDAERLRDCFIHVGHQVGLEVRVLITDGRQPIGRGIGPALEARDVLAVLRNEEDAPDDLRQRSLEIAAALLELADPKLKDKGLAIATEVLANGQAWEKFFAICQAQGRFEELKVAPYTHEVYATTSGKLTSIDNRKLAMAAKLAGAPRDKTAGIDFFVKLDDIIEKGQLLYRLHAESKGELEYALEYTHLHKHILLIENE